MSPPARTAHECHNPSPTTGIQATTEETDPSDLDTSDTVEIVASDPTNGESWTAGVPDPPEGAASEPQFTAITAGHRYTCGLRTDGTVDCWSGHGSSGGTFVPFPGGTFTAITTGWQHSCGLRSDGTVDCWGDDSYGETDPPNGA